MITGVCARQKKKGERHGLKKRNGKCAKKGDVTTPLGGTVDVKHNKELRSE